MEKKEILRIKDLYVEVDGKEILKGINLSIKEGETIAIFGPNGSGKTTLILTILGFSGYKIKSGEIIFKERTLNGLTIDERAKLGIGVLFQKPPSIKGVKFKKILEIISKDGNYKDYIDILKLNELIDRDINYNFSGGELKRSELIQLIAQNPDFMIFDEPESGVDLENIKTIGKTMNKLLQKDLNIINRKKSGVIITHTGGILEFIEVDRGYVLLNGKIICEGNPNEILRNIKENGFKGCERCLT
ncbi:MAG: ATP-binding cassette domain-containing protein [Caldisericia bacterium]|jgi:Fe-S cluster assembly ATP-binding protein|nr:ATP-binding cassette domain-containing protein [Caldisericia bacterium]